MAYTTIDDPSAHFQTTTYTGSGSSGNAITNSGNSDLKPDWLWIKSRSDTEQHTLYDSSRGSTKRLMSDATNAEYTNSTQGIQSFNTDGFTLGENDQNNKSSQTCVAWQWKANGGTTSSNSNGSITSTVQANTTAGFSIVTYVSNNTEGATFGHGLSSAPEIVIVKGRDSADNWAVFNGTSTTNSRSFHLDTTDAEIPVSSYNFWNLYWDETRPSSTVVTLGVDAKVNKSGNENFVAYCFHSVQGYSKIGKYTGNGSSSDGPFVYTGFKPAFFLIKSFAAKNWHILDNKRNTINPVNLYLNPNNTDADGTFTFGDFLSNGFKITNNGNTFNNNGEVYLYYAIAEHPFVSSKGVPTTAR
jgi:hypothetical protein